MKKLPGIIQWLVEELETAEPFEPNEAVPKNGVVIGVMPEELRRLNGLRYTLHRALQSNAQEGMIESLKALDKGATDDLERIMTETERLAQKSELAETLFWLDVRGAFPELADKNSVGVARGWQVYYLKEKEAAECQCEDCVAMRNAGLKVKVFEIPASDGLLGRLGSLLSRLRRSLQTGDSNEPEMTDKPDESGESQAASQPSTESSDQG